MYYTHRKSKTRIKSRISLEKNRKVIKFNQNVWSKLYIDMNTELRKKTKDDFEKYFLKLTNNSVFGKNMENERK